MKCEQIREILETLAPVAMACEWDNPGFQVCRWEKEINSIYLAVDATDEVIAEAKELKADMILTHHPLIFGGIKIFLPVILSAEEFTDWHSRIWFTVRCIRILISASWRTLHQITWN